MKKLIAFLLVGIMTFATAISTFAANPSALERENLKRDLAVIESVSLDSLEEFQAENHEWIDDVNRRLMNHLENFAENERDVELKELLGNGGRTRALSSYFDSYTYHSRGGYMTYSMSPKMSVRLVWGVALTAWGELEDYYSGIRNDNGSLFDQYQCHQHAFIEADWDLEVGRPNVGLAATIAAFCNP